VEKLSVAMYDCLFEEEEEVCDGGFVTVALCQYVDMRSIVITCFVRHNLHKPASSLALITTCIAALCISLYCTSFFP